MKRNLLLTPGPTQIPEDVCAALGRPIIHHRTPQFQENLKEGIAGMQYVLQTKNDVYFLASSGTGGMEAAVANLLSPNDKALTVEGGKFGERWTEICQAYGIRAEVLEVSWGHAVQPQDIKKRLDADKDIKAVFVTHCETSTGVTTDIKAIADAVRKTDAVLVVDAISSVGVIDLNMDAWGVDVVVGASHKGFMLPPGLAFVAVNDKALKMVERSKSPRFYFDFRASKKAAAQNDTPFTPAIGIIVALGESLKIFREKGREAVFEHCERLAKGTRAAAMALGLQIYPDKSCQSNVVTAIKLPEKIDGTKLCKIMRDTYGISIADGQGKLKGKSIRIAHMGCLTEEDIITGFTYLEIVLKELGHSFPAGAGVNAAKKTFGELSVAR